MILFLLFFLILHVSHHKITKLTSKSLSSKKMPSSFLSPSCLSCIKGAFFTRTEQNICTS
jgi:hypothetical protein